MKNINIDELEAGMKLAIDLKDSSGRLLLPKGIVFNEKHIRVLKVWGINSVKINDDSDNQSSKELFREIDPGIIQKSNEVVEDIYKLNKTESEIISELKKQSIVYIALGISKKDLSVEKKVLNYDGNGEPKNDHFASMRKPLRSEEIVKKHTKLFSLPDVFFKIVEVLNNPRSSVDQIAEFVNKDTSLSAKLLKLVNSAYYGFRTKIDSISRAISLLGTKELTKLATGISVINHFNNISSDVMNMRLFWRHSIACGVIAESIALRVNSSLNKKISCEQFFIGGLMHDIGRLIMINPLSDFMIDIMNFSIMSEVPLYKAEKEILGYTHSDIGASITQKWNFPRRIFNMIYYHHMPELDDEPFNSNIIHLADIVATGLKYGSSGQYWVPPFDAGIQDALELTGAHIKTIIEDAGPKIEEIEGVFL